MSGTMKIAMAMEGLIGAAGGDARKLALLARTARTAGDNAGAYHAAEAALAAAPGNAEISILVQDALADGVPPWHLDMLRDDLRTDMYQAAIERAVRPGDRVLDIGSGSGLLAMIAARAGAGHVYSCEANPVIADTARRIVARNGLSERVTIIARRSTALDVAQDLGGPVDLLISEILGGSLIDEGMLPTIEHATRHLLKPGGRMLPQAGQIVVALGDARRADQRRIGTVAGFDLSPMNRLGRRPLRLSVDERHAALRSAPADLFSFDFTRGGDWGRARAGVDLIADGGRVNGIWLWMRVQIDEQTTYDCQPGGLPFSSWVTQFYPLDTPRDVASGERVTVRGWRDDNNVRVWLNGAEPHPA